MRSSWSVTQWVGLSLVSLCIVALLGSVMRYKIAFEFPWLSQKNLQHAHSHFAFAGWITQLLMVYIVAWLRDQRGQLIYKGYPLLLWANLIAAYGMLVSFTMQGYGAVSITFSTLTVFISYAFAVVAIRDMLRIPGNAPGRRWFIAALIWSVLSSAGTFALAYMMATRQVDQHWYLASVYYYLHFQYNGWFFFACAGLFVAEMHRRSLVLKRENTAFVFFAAACVPAYFLSILWAHLPVWLYIIVVIAAGMQFFGWYVLVVSVRRVWSTIQQTVPRVVIFLFVYTALALSLKLLLQMGSTIPEISKLAFGFRPIVMAYLHLILLAILTVFLLAYTMWQGYLSGKGAQRIIMIFCTGIFLNEVVLATQGIAGLSYTPVPYSNPILFYIAILITVSSVGLLISHQRQSSKIKLSTS